MVPKNIAEGLRVCELFVTLDEKEMKTLLDVLGTACETVDYKPGDHIFDQGENEHEALCHCQRAGNAGALGQYG
ncbi:MAG TPA: hypothetical protein VGA85_02590 [Dehalococcoidales bacterium]